MMQVLSVAILERTPLKQLFFEGTLTKLDPHHRNQLRIFYF